LKLVLLVLPLPLVPVLPLVRHHRRKLYLRFDVPQDHLLLDSYLLV
jgi:hypothetical protein